MNQMPENIVPTKICSVCHQEKTLEHYYFCAAANQYNYRCRSCDSVYGKGYREDNNEKLRAYDRAYYAANCDHLKAKSKQYKEDNAEIVLEKEKIRMVRKRRSNPSIRLHQAISVRVGEMLRLNGSAKYGRSILEFIDYTPRELQSYIESLFEHWMSWDNYGKYNKKTWKDDDPTTWTWQLDHIIPHSEFHYTSMDCQEFRDCWALSNLRPLSAKQNQLDGATRIRHK